MTNSQKQAVLQKVIDWVFYHKTARNSPKFVRRHAIQAVAEAMAKEVTGSYGLIVLAKKDMLAIASATGGTYVSTKGPGNLAEIRY